MFTQYFLGNVKLDGFLATKRHIPPAQQATAAQSTRQIIEVMSVHGYFEPVSIDFILLNVLADLHHGVVDDSSKLGQVALVVAYLLNTLPLEFVVNLPLFLVAYPDLAYVIDLGDD